MQHCLERNLAVDLAVPAEAEQISNLRAALNQRDDTVPVGTVLPVVGRLLCSERWIVHSWMNATTPGTSVSVPGKVARSLENDQMA